MIPDDLGLYALVLVTWVDSNYVIGWRPHNEPTAKLPRAQTVGFVTAFTPDLIEISGSIGEEVAKLNPLTIPRISVIEFEVLRPSVLTAQSVEEEHTHDLPETVESDADFNFRRMQEE